MNKVAVVFPGQGSQYIGMGRDFYDNSPVAKELFELAENKSSLPIKKLCFEGPFDELTLTVNLQPALLTVDIVCWEALKQKGIIAYAMAGHSLGEYAALAASGVLSAEEAIALCSLRGRIMDRQANAHPGAMAAVMGLAPHEVAEITQQAGGIVQAANFNTNQQTVITGETQAVQRAAEIAKANKAKVIPLKVSGAWHSPLMAKAGEEMAQALEPITFKTPSCLHVPNVTGVPTNDPALIKGNLLKQMTSPVRWVQSVEAMLADGVDIFIEAGPKNVLAGLIGKIAPAGVKVYNFQDRQSLDDMISSLEQA